MAKLRKYIFLFPLKRLSFKCQVVNQQLKQCLSLVLEQNTGLYLQQKKSQNDNSPPASEHVMLKDISTYNCCQAKPIYLFLVIPILSFLS